MANFEPFHWVISSSINLSFLKSVALRHFPKIKFRLLLCHCVSPSVSSDILIEYKWHSSRHISQLFIENLYFVANNLSLLYNIHLKIIVLLHCFTLFFLKKYYIPLIELFAIFFACYFHTYICGWKRISKGGHYVNCPCNFIFHVIGH